MKQAGIWMRVWMVAIAACSTAGLSRADLEIKPRAADVTVAATAGRDQPFAKRWRGEADQRPEGDRIIDRLVANSQVMEQLGVANEAVNHMRDDLRDVQSRAGDLENRVRQLSLDQAEQMKRFFQSRDVGTNALMRLADEIGRARIEQAKLTIQRMVVIRKYLTPEQIGQARELMRERMAKEREARGEPAVKQERRDRAAPAAAPNAQPLTKPPEGW